MAPFPFETGLHFVVRLNTAGHPTFTEKKSRIRKLSLAPGEWVNAYELSNYPPSLAILAKIIILCQLFVRAPISEEAPL